MNNNDNNRVNEQIKQQQINNQLEQRSNLSKGMAPYQHYKKTHVKSSIDDNKRMKDQLNSVSRKGSSSLGGLGGTVNRGVNAAKDYKNASTVKDKEKAKSQMKGSVANGAVTAFTGSSTLGNLAEKAVKMKDKLNPLKAAKNAILGKINGDEEEEQYDELGNPKQQENRLENVSFTIPPKVIKWALIAGLPSFVAIIFIVLFVTASQTYINILGIDSADKVTEEQLESKDDKWHEEGEGATDPDKVETYNFKNNKELIVDNFIEESNNENIVLVANERTHEAELGNINDYFSKKLKCEGDKCQEEPEYLFYLKMHDIYYLYKIKYKVILDLPLLMSALSIGDEEIVNIFEMNSKNFTLKDHEVNLDYIKKCQEGNCPSDILNIDPAYNFKNLSGYLYLSSSDFSYDMQILAQNMVTKNGDSYTKDLDHFDEFLDEYIEYKFYISDKEKKEIYSKNPTQTDTSESNGMADVMLNVANNELATNGNNNGAKYNRFVGAADSTAWCAAFVSYVISNTNYNNQNLKNDIIKYQANIVGSYAVYFKNTSGLRLEINGNCSKYKSYTSSSYIPKKGDLIMFNWNGNFKGSVCVDGCGFQHIGIVESYSDGTVYTIEGNSGYPGRIRKKSYPLNSCNVIAYGVWY